MSVLVKIFMTYIPTKAFHEFLQVKQSAFGLPQLSASQLLLLTHIYMPSLLQVFNHELASTSMTDEPMSSIADIRKACACHRGTTQTNSECQSKIFHHERSLSQRLQLRDKLHSHGQETHDDSREGWYVHMQSQKVHQNHMYTIRASTRQWR